MDSKRRLQKTLQSSSGTARYSQNQMQTSTHRRPAAPATKNAPLNREPAVKIYDGCTAVKSSKEDSPVVSLQNFCKQMNLEQPTYKTILIGCEHGQGGYNCKVQVGDVTGQDPTARDGSTEQAQENAAKILLSKLNVKYASSSSSQKQTLTNFTDWETIMLRLNKVVTKNGMWKSCVESTYEVNFKERLPPNWFQFAKGCDFFEIPSIDVEIIALAQIPELPSSNIKFSKGDLLSLKVTLVESLDQVWFSTDNINAELIKMTEELKAAVYKGVIQFGMFFLRKNTYCLARMNNELLRVKIKSANLQSAICLLIDFGVTESIPLSDLTLLPCKCWKLPPQVFCFGLHEVGKLPIRSPEAMQYAQMFLQSFGTLDAVVEYGGNSDRMDLLLFARNQDDVKPVNIMLLHEMISNYLNPQLPLPYCMGPAVVSHVPESGSPFIFVQPQPEVTEWLLNELQTACYNNLLHEQSCPKTEPGTLYLVMMPNEVKENSSRSWIYHRVLMQSKRTVGICTNVQVLFIDTGLTSTVLQHKMRNFPPKNLIDFGAVPPQAVECKLGDSNLNSLSVEQLPLKKIVHLCTIAPESDGQLPIVSIQLVV